MRERNTYPLSPPPRTRQPERRSRTYQEQHLSHHIPAVREHFAYKPPPGGKAAEFFGVGDVKEFDHNFSAGREKKKGKTWRTRKFRVTKNNAKKTKVKRTAPPVERVQTFSPSDSTAEFPLMSHFSWSGDEKKVKKFKKNKKETGGREEKRSTGCTIM